MKKLVLVLSVLALALAIGCGGGGMPQKDMDGKAAPAIEKAAGANSAKVAFTFVLDKTGAEAIAAVIEKEIKNAQNDKNKEKEEALGKIKSSFASDPAKVIKQVFVAGPFTGWDSNKVALDAGKSGEFVTFGKSVDVEFSIDKEQYKYVFTLNAGSSAADSQNLWVADPLASEFVDDGFGGKNSLLVLPGFTAPKAEGEK
jgi:hypothetical protein